MGNINVILGSEGKCCLCSDLPHCGDCKKGDEPPPPGEPCNCNDYGAYNIPTCKEECIEGCEACTFVFACPDPNDSHGCYQCISTCSCESGGEFPLGTDCKALGFEGSEPATVDCGECPSIECTHCYCLPCSEYGYVYCTQVEKECPSKKGTPVPTFPGSQCPSGCCTCDPVEDCECSDFGKFPFGTDCTEFGYDRTGFKSVEGPCIDEEGKKYNIDCIDCKCATCATNGWVDDPEECPDGKAEMVMPGKTSDLCPVGCWECDEPQPCDEGCYCFGCPGGCIDCPEAHPCCDSACVTCGDCGSCAVECGCTSQEILSLKESIPDCKEAEFIKYDTLKQEVLEINDDPSFVSSALAAAAYIGMYNRSKRTFHFSPNGARRYLQVLLAITKVDVAHHASYIELAVEEGRNEIRARGRNLKNEL